MWPGLRNIRSPLIELISELTVRVLLLIVVVLLQLQFQPHVRYITEDDLLTIYKKPRRDSYVPAWATVSIIIVIPLIFILFSWVMTRNLMDTSQAFLAWTLALGINAVITEIIKLIVGRPRPDFFYRCFPNGKITKDLHCTGDVNDIIEGRKSFPSGHSSFSFCSLGFLSLWLCGQLRVLSRNRGEAARVIICLLPLMLATVVAISRCCDNHHHWEDVFTGALIGFMTSCFCYNQYYNSLHTDLSGYPYMFPDSEVLEITSRIECSTRHLENDVYYLKNDDKEKIVKSD